MSRKPVYHAKKNSIRIVSCPNGQWQLEECYGKSTREHDAWRSVARPTDFATASQQLKRHCERKPDEPK